MAVKQLRDSVYGCIFVDGDHSIFFQADGQQSGGAVPNDSSFVGNNTFYNTGDFAYVGEFLAARCGIGHQIKYNVIHDFRPGAGFNGYLGVFAATNYPTDNACVNVFGVIDSNVYYDPSDAIRFQKAAYGSNMTLAQWQATPSFDVHSVVSTGALLVNPAGGNYAPTAAVPAMNVSYGGRTWTRWGAVQDGTPPPLDVTSPSQVQNLAVTGTGMPVVGENLAMSVTPTVCGTYSGMHLLSDDRANGPVNMAAPEPVTNAEFTRILARVLRRPAFLPVPAFAARAAFGQLADELLLASTRLRPKRLLDLGFEFRYPGLEASLSHQLGRS